MANLIIIGFFAATTPISAFSMQVSGQEYNNMPQWVKNNAKWLADGKISDSEFMAGIKYLIQHQIIQLSSNQNVLATSSISISSPAKHCLDRTFTKVDWSNCNFSGANLKKVNLANSNLMGIDFSNANLEKAFLVKTNMEGANLQNAILLNTMFSDSDLSNTSLIGIDGKFVNLSAVNLSHANLSNANLFNAALMGANMQNANLAGANLNRADLSSADLSGADLSGANMADVDLYGANLTNTNLHCIGNPVCVK